MKLKLKAGVAAAATTALVVAGAGTAFAYTGAGTTNTVTPPWETGNTLFTAAPNFPNLDPNSKGGILFYDAAGNQISGGSSLNNIGTYLATTGTAARTNATLANALFAVPDHTKPTIQWVTAGATGSNAFPVATPGPVLSATTPVATLNTAGGEGSIAAIAGVITNDTTTGYDHILQVRVKDSGIGVPTSGLNSVNYYWSADIEYNNTATAFADGLAPGAWKVVYPAVVNQATVTDAPVPSLASPQQFGASVSFSTTVHVGTAAGAGVTGGTVQFFDGATQIGATKTVNASGQATSDATTTLSIATHSITAVYTPAAGAVLNGSTSSATSFQVTAPSAHSTTTGLVVGTASVTQPAPLTATATVTDTTASVNVTAGQVVFHLDSAAGAVLGTDSDGTDGWNLSAPSGAIPAGSHTVFAVFSGTGGTSGVPSRSPSFDYNGSTSAAGSFSVVSGIASNVDVQNIQTSIAAGTITITTDYTPTNKLVVPPLQLNGTGTFFTNGVNFGHIQVNDQRAGNIGYDLFAQSSDLARTSPAGPVPSGTVGSIDKHNVGFTGVGVDGGFTSTTDTSALNVSFFDAPAASAIQPGAASTAGLGEGAKITHANHGYGNLVLKALLTINAPLNTYSGTYDGTITFTAYSA